MARVIFSSGNLLRHARAFDALGADTLTVTIEAPRLGCAVLTAPTIRTEIPVESRWYGTNALLSVPKLLAALKSIPDQPITLDLHDGQPCKLFAVRSRAGRPGDYEPVEFAL